MKKIIGIIIFIILFYIYPIKGLVELTVQNINTELSKFNDRAIILLHQGWCNESREFESFLNSVQSQQQSQTDPQLKINFLYINVNEQKILTDKIPDKGQPAIYLYNKGNYTQYEYDILSRRQFKYQIDLFFFEKVLNIQSVKSFEEQKQKFQCIFIGKKQQFPKIYSTFIELSKNNSLYTFIESEEEGILDKFFIQKEQSNSSENENNQSAYIIIVRKYDRYDKYLRIVYDNDKSMERLNKFFEEYQKPYRLYTFNHRVRKYLIEKGYYSVTLFYRKKIFQDEYIYQSFYNVTRDVKSIIEGKKEDYYNYVSRIKSQVQSDVVFLFIDKFENNLTKKLADYMEDSQFEYNPSVFIFRFNIEKRILDKFKFKIKHQDFIIFSELMLFLQNVLHEGSQKSILFLRNQNLDEKILTLNPKIMQLSSYYFERSYSERYLKMMKKEKVINIILFMSKYSRSSLELITILSKVQKNLNSPTNIEIQFSLFDVSENDQDLFEFIPPIKIVPEIRVYTQRHKYIVLDIKKIQRFLDSNNEKQAQATLEFELKEILKPINQEQIRVDL